MNPKISWRFIMLTCITATTQVRNATYYCKTTRKLWIHCNQHLGINKSGHKFPSPSLPSIGDHIKQTGHITSLDHFNIISQTDNCFDFLFHESLLFQRNTATLNSQFSILNSQFSILCSHVSFCTNFFIFLCLICCFVYPFVYSTFSCGVLQHICSGAFSYVLIHYVIPDSTLSKNCSLSFSLLYTDDKSSLSRNVYLTD